TQPQGTAQMTVGGGNRNAKGLPLDAEGKRDWSFPLLGCFGDIGKCCWATWCPCIIHSQTRRRLDHLNRNGVPDPSPDKMFTGDSAVYACVQTVFDMGWVLQIATRKDIRQRYNIQGSGASDCCAPFCCTPCDLVQGAREVELEELSFQQVQA
ncbi:PLAC8 family-domain-containing protein, partial [Pholiota molesta]